MKRNIQIEAFYPHPPERIWKALTDPEAIAVWLMPNDFKPVVGHKFQFKTRPRPGFDGTVHCEVLELDEPHRLSYTWAGGVLDTTVTFTLEPVPEGTRLTLEHSGFTGARGLMAWSIMNRGWRKKILKTNLPAILDRMKV
jgi:uncharacterized protein YndB with AHSA1/START domain